MTQNQIKLIRFYRILDRFLLEISERVYYDIRDFESFEKEIIPLLDDIAIDDDQNIFKIFFIYKDTKLADNYFSFFVNIVHILFATGFFEKRNVRNFSNSMLYSGLWSVELINSCAFAKEEEIIDNPCTRCNFNENTKINKVFCVNCFKMLVDKKRKIEENKLVEETQKNKTVKKNEEIRKNRVSESTWGKFLKE